MYWEAAFGLSSAIKSRMTFKSLLAKGVNRAIPIA